LASYQQNRRDPRFDALSGELDESRFRTSYSFIDEARSEEIKRLRYAISQARKRKGAVDMDELDAMAAELQRLQSKQAEHERRQRQATVVSGWKNEERQKRETGKAAFFLKKGRSLLFTLGLDHCIF
jgi:ribosomal RNA-processing protein 36